jgi:hypothetical protein
LAFLVLGARAWHMTESDSSETFFIAGCVTLFGPAALGSSSRIPDSTELPLCLGLLGVVVAVVTVVTWRLRR